MAANSATKNKTTDQPAKKLTTYDLTIGILAIFSLIILVILIFVKLPPSTEAVLNSLENILGFVFLFDFFRSLSRAPKKWAYFLKGGGWLDLLGSLPFSKLAIFRAARLFRVIRIMRSLKASDYRKILVSRLAQSTLLFTLVAALLLVFIIGGIVLFAEQGAPNANIRTYQDAVWWAFVTIATVGYGDYYPVTSLGRSMAVILMFFGIGIIGVLSSYLATTFLSFESNRRDANDGKKGNDVKDDNEDDTSSLKAELVAIKEEMSTIKQLLEERNQAE